MTGIPENLEKIIDKGSEIGGSMTGAAIGLAIADPAGILYGAAVGPLVALAFKRIGTEISEMILGPREMARVGATYSLAYEKINNKILNGDKIREDDFFSKQNIDRSKSETLLEGTLLKARNEYEEKKIKFYSNFLANLNFNEAISFEKGNTLLRILEQLSYRQLSILSYFNDVDKVNTDRWQISFKDVAELGDYQDFYSELMNLYNQQLIQQSGNGISMGISTIRLSPLGKSMYDLLNLEELNPDDKKIVQDSIETIDKIKK
jgi:hypothetical protein